MLEFSWLYVKIEKQENRAIKYIIISNIFHAYALSINEYTYTCMYVHMYICVHIYADMYMYV